MGRASVVLIGSFWCLQSERRTEKERGGGADAKTEKIVNAVWPGLVSIQGLVFLYIGSEAAAPSNLLFLCLWTVLLSIRQSALRHGLAVVEVDRRRLHGRGRVVCGGEVGQKRRAHYSQRRHSCHWR